MGNAFLQPFFPVAIYGDDQKAALGNHQNYSELASIPKKKIAASVPEKATHFCKLLPALQKIAPVLALFLSHVQKYFAKAQILKKEVFGKN